MIALPRLINVNCGPEVYFREKLTFTPNSSVYHWLDDSLEIDRSQVELVHADLDFSTVL